MAHPPTDEDPVVRLADDFDAFLAKLGPSGPPEYFGPLSQLKEAIERRQVDRNVFNDEQLAAIFAEKPTIPGYRWHHHQEFGRI